MILGIGTDIADIARIEKIIKNTNFCERFFTDNENKYFEQRKFSSQTVAGNFAAKEAVAKALGTGVRGFFLKDIEVLRDELGKPYVNISGKAGELCKGKIHISISHSREYATAFAVIEGV